MLVRKLFLVFMLLFSFAAIMPEVHASGKPQDMPYEKPLEKIMNSLTGPVAKALAVVGICVAGGMLIFGGQQLDGFARQICLVVLVASVMVGANSLFTTLGIAGQVVEKAAE